MLGLLCVFIVVFLGVLVALLRIMKAKQFLVQLDRAEMLYALAYEQPVPLTIENLELLRGSLPPYADTVWCLGYNEYKHLVMLKRGDGRYALDAADGKLLGDPLVMVQLSLPGHEVLLAYVPLGTRKAINTGLGDDLPEPGLPDTGRKLSEVRREME